MDQNNRYDRQIRLPYIDHAGQEKLGRAHVAIVGQGALGTAASSYLARAGVGHILIIDNDIVELSNLQRQTLFDESDVGRSKADAACEHRRANGSRRTMHLPCSAEPISSLTQAIILRHAR